MSQYISVRINMLQLQALLMVLSVSLVLSSSAVAEDNGCDELLKEKSLSLQSLRQENSALKLRVEMLQRPYLTAPDLNSRMSSRLKDIAAEVRLQRQAMNEFQGYVTWMSGSIAGYSKYIEAGSMAAGFAKVLPIPYAGQAGTFTKFVSHFALSLSEASRSITKFLSTSQLFLGRMEVLDRHPEKQKEMVDLAGFADGQLLRDMSDLQSRLGTISDCSASALSFMESLNHYASSSDEYWARAKSLVKRRDLDRKEKSYLAESVSGLRNKAGAFNDRLKLYDSSVSRNIPMVKSLGTYLELLSFLQWREAEEGQPTPAPPDPPVAVQ